MGIQGFLIIIGLLVLWLVGISYFMIRTQRAFSHFTKGVAKKDLRTVLEHLAKSFDSLSKDLEGLEKLVQTEVVSSRKHVQKVGLLRFNPFSDTGGNQSFVLCLLDEGNNGIVVTSLHSRDQTRTYAKQVINGRGEGQALSREEEEAIKIALKQHKKRLKE